MATNVRDTISFENAHIIFRNFSGKVSEYNRNGDRTFDVVIDNRELVDKLLEDGWNVKERTPKKDDSDPFFHLQVKVAFGNIPPAIWLVTSKAKRRLTEETVGELDYADIANVDLIIRPYNWTVQPGTKNEKSGVKAYLKSMYVTLREDEFAEKYSDKFSDGAEEEDYPY